jgi:hypothetical protein
MRHRIKSLVSTISHTDAAEHKKMRCSRASICPLTYVAITPNSEAQSLYEDTDIQNALFFHRGMKVREELKGLDT